MADKTIYDNDQLRLLRAAYFCCAPDSDIFILLGPSFFGASLPRILEKAGSFFSYNPARRSPK